jgi:DNA-binding MarR family transcriptional regulator
MNKTQASKDIMNLFIEAVHRYNALEKIPHKTGAEFNLYHSERHLIDMIGDLPDANMTGFARSAGMTKGAVSQFVRKLESKGLVRRYKKGNNDKEVFLELTDEGRIFYQQHRKRNEETTRPLRDELKRHPDEHIRFFIDMLTWINSYLYESRKQIER